MFEKLSKKNILILLVLIIALPLAVYLVQQVTKLFPKALPGDVEIIFVPDTASLPPNATFQVMIDAKSNRVGFARVEIDFDNLKINLVNEIQTTNKLKTLIEKTSVSQANSSGHIVVVLGLSPEDKNVPPSGAIDFALLTFARVSSQSGGTSISIDNTGVQIVDLDVNELPFTSGTAAITLVASSTPTNTPTITPTSIPTNTAKPTNTPTPTPTATNTPIPTLTATLIPTQTPTLLPTSTSTGTPIPTSTPRPSSTPTLQPTRVPTDIPTPQPTIPPTGQPTITPLPGDIDGDNDVDIFDYNILVSNFGDTDCGNPADIDGNCKVDIFDYNILIGNFGK